MGEPLFRHTDTLTSTTVRVWPYPYGAGVDDFGIQVTLGKPGPDGPLSVRLPHPQAVELATTILRAYGADLADREPHEGDDEMFSPAEVAAMFSVDVKTVAAWGRSGKLRALRTPGGHRRYRMADLRPFLNGGGR